MQDNVVHPIAQLQPIYFFTGLFSLLASLFVLIGFCVVPRVRETMVMQILSIVAVCSIGLSLKYFIPSAKNQLGRPGHSCNTEAFVGQFFSTAIVCWYGTLFINSFRALYGHNMLDTRNTMLLSHGIIWTFSFSTSLLCLNLDQFGMTEDGTCWIADGQNPFRLFFYIPLLGCMFACIALLVTLFRRITPSDNLEYENPLPQGARRRMVTFLGVFLVTWVWSLSVAIFELLGVKTPSALLIFYALTIPGQGVSNFFLWVTSPLLLPGFTIEEEPTYRVSMQTSSMESSRPTESTVHEYNAATSSSMPFRYSPLRETLLHGSPSDWTSKKFERKRPSFLSR